VLATKAKSALRLGLLRMRHLCAVPWLTPSRQTLLSIGVATILVVSLLAVLEINGGGRQVPTKELLTGSIPKAAAVRKSASDDPIVAFFASSTPFVTQPAQIALVDRHAVPLPRPRPKRL
jgi:hypothetical protein